MALRSGERGRSALWGTGQQWLTLGPGREAFLERGSQEMATNLRAGRPRPQSLSSHPRPRLFSYLLSPWPSQHPPCDHRPHTAGGCSGGISSGC